MLLRIRRHNNGKYYDLTHSCYISLYELKEEILSGATLKVLTCDNLNITVDVLSRIRLNQLKSKSLDHLTKLIKGESNGNKNQI
jgi:hypothetical protein